MGEDSDKASPSLSEEIRYHLGRLLISAYDENTAESENTSIFGALLEKLRVALEASDLKASTEFKNNLLKAAPALRRFALSLSKDRTTADDLVQDTMLRAWRSQASFTPGTNLEAWTFTIMRNQFYSYRRKQNFEIQDENDVHTVRLVTPPEQGGHLDLQDVRAALDRLAPVMREALVLVGIENLSYEEAAAVMGCQIGTAKSRVWRARTQLVRILGYDGADIGADGFMSSAMAGSTDD